MLARSAAAIFLALLAPGCAAMNNAWEHGSLTPAELSLKRGSLDQSRVTLVGYVGGLPGGSYYLKSSVVRKNAPSSEPRCYSQDSLIFPIKFEEVSDKLERLFEDGLQSGKFKKIVVEGLLHNEDFVVQANLYTNTYSAWLNHARLIAVLDAVCVNDDNQSFD